MCTRAVRMLTGASGYTLTANEAADLLTILTSLIDSLNTQRGLIYQILKESHALVAGTATYTMGTAGTFGSVRPVKIEKAFVRDTNNIDVSQLDICGFDQYDDIVSKTTQSTYPTHLFNDCSIASGAATITLWPVPSAAYTLFIDSWKQLQAFTALSENLLLPPGYQRFLEYSLAVEYAPEKGIKATDKPEIWQGLKDARASIKRVNAPDLFLHMPAGIVGHSRYNIYADS